MGDWRLRFYHTLPYPLKVAIATGRGLVLRQWRYGRETERLVAEALGKEHWTPGQWRSWQQEQLIRILDRAATKVPYYRAHWNKRRSRGDQSSWKILENWPILSKDEVRLNPRAFVAEDRRTRWMLHESTSGSTGKALDIWSSRSTCRRWYALFEARGRRWNGVNMSSRWAILGGQLVVPQQQRNAPFWVWNQAFNQLYLSVYHMSPAFLTSYLEALRSYRVEYLMGYTSALYTLAQAVLREKHKDLKMAVVIANAEPLYDHQRAVISEAFGCAVRETYGMSEFVAGASECSAGNLHYWPEAGYLEVLRSESSGKNDEPGELVCTGLLNQDMPLIRYRVGDSGYPLQWDHSCPCGRSLPILPSIEGRMDDLLLTSDGREVGRLDPVFKGGLPVVEAQIIQETLARITIKVVPGPGYGPAAEKEISHRVRQRMGEIQVVVEVVEAIPRTKAGKFKAVVSLLNGRKSLS